MTDALSVEAFEALVGSTFAVVGEWEPDGTDPATVEGDAPDTASAESPAVELLLTKVVRLDHAGPFEQFRAVFTGPRTTPLDQGTFVLDPPPGGLDGLLLVPAEERDDERVYVASLSVRRTSTESVGS